MATKLVQVEHKSKIYFGFVETQPNLEDAGLNVVQVEHKNKINFVFVETQPNLEDAGHEAVSSLRHGNKTVLSHGKLNKNLYKN